MSNYNYNLRLQSLRQTTTLIGVVGMTASGKSEFEKVVAEQGYPFFSFDYQGIMDDTELPLSEIGSFPPKRQTEILAMDNGELINAMLEDYGLYERAKNAMFDIHMNILANKMRDVLSDAPFLKDNGIVFVECPISTRFKYSDAFDAVITIQRPQTYNEGLWWVDYYTDGMSEYSTNSSINSLKHSDKMFSQLQISEVAATVNNSGDLETFQSNIITAIDDVVEVLESR